tara:strand:+ start:193 stop:1326 length:1134 start_codon:yes stop_codon:yes gene_type:complete
MAGSGAGAELTKIAESAQCVVAAARFYCSSTDLTPAMLTETMMKKALTYCDVDDSRIVKNIFEKLDADWHVSLCLTANKLHDLYGSQKGAKNYVFHRGSKFVDKFESEYKKWNDQADKFFSNINKYTPADIWMTARKFKDFKWDEFYQKGLQCGGEGCFAEANKFMIEKYDSRDIIGISLKKTSTAPVSYYNMPGMAKYTFKYTGFTLSSGDFFGSKDVYIKYNKGKIQFRSFSSRPTSWQGEIKGAEANLGKIGGGVITKVVHATFPRKDKDIFAITESNVISEEVKKPKDLAADFVKDFHYYYKGLASGRKLTEAEMAVGLRKKEATWIYSKYLGMELLTLFEDLSTREQNQLITNILLYAMSASPDSAPFVKIG